MSRRDPAAHTVDRGGVGVVLAGGGARGAYELGALSVLLPVLEQRGESPRIFVGTSVGAISAAGLAATSHLPAQEAIMGELARWHEVDRGAVISPILPRLPLTALRFAGELLSLPGVRLASLLDPSPLERNLRRWIDWPQLHQNLAGSSTCRLAVLATAARTGRAVAFVEGATEDAISASHVIDYVPATLNETHVRASAAIPILFPPVRVEDPPEARGWYIDGATRLNTPIKPALDLGAERDLAVLSRLLGGQSNTHGELLSYLLFDREFITALIEMGAQDATAWLNAPPGIEEPWQLDPLEAFTQSVRPADAAA